MRTVPRNITPRLQFFETRLARWAERATEIGTSPEEVAALAVKTQATREALKKQRQLAQQARSATLALRIACREMSTAGAGIIHQVRAKAMGSGKGVFTAAWIKQPAKPSPIGAPGTPTRFSQELQQNGWLTLRWTCKNPRGSVGTMYHVSRQIGFHGAKEYLGTVGRRKFVDKTLPAGAGAVVYWVKAVRSTATGPEASYNVNLGGSGFAGEIVHVRAA